MKAIIEKMLECLLAFLPFLSKRSKKKVEKMKEFSELVREQYGFLVGQLEKVLQDYFGSGFFYTGVCCVFPMKRSIFAPIYINNNDV